MKCLHNIHIALTSQRIFSNGVITGGLPPRYDDTDPSFTQNIQEYSIEHMVFFTGTGASFGFVLVFLLPGARDKETITQESLFPGKHGHFRSSRGSRGNKKSQEKN
jgi:hypothetical protein